MSVLTFRLFGKFGVLLDDQPVETAGSGKAQELLAYLLIYNDRAHTRERLADLLWEASPNASAKKYLRQALWQMQQALPIDGLIENEDDWVRVSSQVEYRLDVGEFEQAFAGARGVPGQELEAAVAAELEQAVALYRADLLEDWYSDWCIFERERLQNVYLAMLDKLVGYCEVRRDYEAGLAYGMRVLRSDRARERTHRQMMRLAYLSGDRTGALRQYQRCAKALQEELGVRPSHRTEALHQQLLNDGYDADQPVETRSARTTEVRGILIRLRSRINEDLDALEHALTDAE